MSYPLLKNKHAEEALFHPKDYVDYAKWKEKHRVNFPRKYILVYKRSVLRHFKRKFKGMYDKISLRSTLKIYLYKNIGLVIIKGIGSPNAVAAFEELIALGGKEFITIGTAGGLRERGVFLCTKAARDEGTSYHYLPHGKYSYPDKKLTERFGRVLTEKGIGFTKAPTWTIDAPYRETRKEIEYYKKQGVATVDMEASALFAVAKVRKVKIAAAFVVSDILGEKWVPEFHRIDVKKAPNRMLDAAVDCFSSR